MPKSLPDVCVWEGFPARELLARLLNGCPFFRGFWLVVRWCILQRLQDRIAPHMPQVFQKALGGMQLVYGQLID
jgi:hypothetical protein